MKITKISLNFYSTNSFLEGLLNLAILLFTRFKKDCTNMLFIKSKKKKTTHSYINKKSYNINLQLIFAIFYLLNQVIPIICKALLPRQDLPF